MIHIYLESAKDIKMEEGATVDPVVECNVLGEKKFSKALKKIDATGVAMWNEHIFFEPKNVSEERLTKGTIELKLQDKGFFKDTLLGYYEFDLTKVYQMTDHALMHKYVVLTNPDSEEFGEVTGYLKLSITIAGAADTQVPIEDDPNPEKEDILQPPGAKPEFYQLYIRFIGAQKIVPLDKGYIGVSSVDAYVRFDYKTKKLKTKAVTQVENGEIRWDEEFLVPSQLPVMGGRLKFKIFDEDTLVDELVGSFELNAKDIIYEQSGKFFWKNIYGAPLDTSGDAAEMMNNDPATGSLWKGRILM